MGVGEAGIHLQRFSELDDRVVEAAGGLPVKVILEAHHLTDDQIVEGSRLAVRAGAAFVKTGTGYSAFPAVVTWSTYSA